MFTLALLLFYGGRVLAASKLELPEVCTSGIYNLEDAHIHFEEFIQAYNKQYKNEEEKQYRFEIFKQELHEINKMNEGLEKSFYVITQFADLTDEEFKKYYTGHKVDNDIDLRINGEPCAMGVGNLTLTVESPADFDWREQNKVTSVKDQGQCGSCWAQAATGVIESVYAIKYNELVDFSAQQLLDCSQAGSCGGGSAQSAIMYLIRNGGHMMAADYPYQPVQGQCRFDPSRVKARVSSCINFMNDDEESLTDVLVNYGPLAFGVDGDCLRRYSTGIAPYCPAARINHAVLLIGYGTENGVPYWIGKNSWGSEWGEQGFFRIIRGQGTAAMNTYDKVGAVVI